MEVKKKFEGKHSELTSKILGAFFQIHKEMGFGFSERVYECALEVLLREIGLVPERQKEILVDYHDRVVGEYRADMIVNGVVLLEIKSVEKLIEAHDAQLLNYLKSTRIEVGLLLNFGRQGEFHRKIYDNARKGTLAWSQNP
ncbi:MAG TPA: GxxExxY protein [Anaerolineales bacterium]|nr:GxxExxY protein [Anaerolineales bacterium]